MTAAFRNILLDQPETGIHLLTVNRPKVLNALYAETLDEIAAALSKVAADDAALVVYPASDLRAKGLEMARAIASKGPVAVRLAKQSVRRGANLDLFAACALETDLFAQAFATLDRKEGMSALLEKRPARFTGR